MTMRSGLKEASGWRAFAIRPARWIHDPIGFNRIMVSSLIAPTARGRPRCWRWRRCCISRRWSGRRCSAAWCWCSAARRWSWLLGRRRDRAAWRWRSTTWRRHASRHGRGRLWCGGQGPADPARIRIAMLPVLVPMVVLFPNNDRMNRVDDPRCLYAGLLGDLVAMTMTHAVLGKRRAAGNNKNAYDAGERQRSQHRKRDFRPVHQVLHFCARRLCSRFNIELIAAIVLPSTQSPELPRAALSCCASKRLPK